MFLLDDRRSPPVLRRTSSARRAAFFSICYAILALRALAADAAEDQYDDLRFLRLAPEQSSSQCIGDPRTPLCAVESYSACLFRGEPKWCEAAGRSYPHDRALTRDGLGILVYQILGMRELRADDIPAERRDRGPASWQPGDAVVLIQWYGCNPRRECLDAVRGKSDRAKREACPPVNCTASPGPGIPTTYVTRRAGELWILVDSLRGAEPSPDYWGR